MGKMEELLCDLERCERPRTKLTKGPREQKLKRWAARLMYGTAAFFVCALSAGACQKFRCLIQNDGLQAVALCLLAWSMFLSMLFVILSIAADVAGDRFRKCAGEPRQVSSLVLVERAERAHIDVLSKYSDDLLRCASQYLRLDGLPVASGGSVANQAVVTVCTVIGAIAGACTVGGFTITALSMWHTAFGSRLMPFVVAFCLLALSVVFRNWQIWRRRRYHLWLVEMVLSMKIATPAPTQRESCIVPDHAH